MTEPVFASHTQNLRRVRLFAKREPATGERNAIASPRARDGFTLIEVVVGMSILLVGVLGFTRAMIGASHASQRTREVDRATQAARQVLEKIDAEAFAEAFRRYNADPSDDPGGANTAPGANFAVPGLRAVAGDADGLPGEIVFPTQPGAPGVLREDVVDAKLGMPRDLDGSGAVDAANHATDYKLLPVLVRVRWSSAAGPASIELSTLLANY